MFALAKASHITIAATTSYGEIAEACLVSTRLYSYIDCLVTAEDVKRPKPHPDAILRVIRLFCSNAGEVDSACVMCVGDTPADIHAGKNAGVRTVGVTYGVAGDAEIRLAEPDWIIHSFGEMRSFLAGARPAKTVNSNSPPRASPATA